MQTLSTFCSSIETPAFPTKQRDNLRNMLHIPDSLCNACATLCTNAAIVCSTAPTAWGGIFSRHGTKKPAHSGAGFSRDLG
jgi:hypothetical protein